MPAHATLEAFKARLRGELLQASDAGYETARQVYNGMIDRHPRLIVRCANVADVIAAVHFGRDHDLLVSDEILHLELTLSSNHLCLTL